MWLGVLCSQVLKGVAATFPDFVVSNLGQGVTEAFDFQSRLWAAKHPGQPLPKGKQSQPPHLQLFRARRFIVVLFIVVLITVSPSRFEAGCQRQTSF
jgi:hypothetical protein